MILYGCCVDKACTDRTCMNLPAGTTCGDCAHKNRCLALGYTDSEDATSCSFFPRRLFQIKTAKTVEGAP